MNRKIKFAWVCRNIKFNEIHRIELTDEILINRTFPSWIITENCEVIAKILPTGKKDKNGKEIYEGDIVRYETEDGDVWTAQIVWDTGEENIFISGFTSKPIQDITDEIYSENGNAPIGWTGEVEVIGNIYENPELLEGK